MNKKNNSLVAINLTIFMLNLLFIIIATYFIAQYWDEKGIFVAQAISIWLTLGALSRHYWYVAISLLVIVVFLITRASSSLSSKIVGSKLTFWLLMIWSGILYVPIIYVQLFIIHG